MFLYSRDLVAYSKEETPNVKAMAMELLNTNTPIDIAMKLAEMIIAEKSASQKRIVVSQEEMNTILSIFRVKGLNEDGTPSKKGRPAANSQA